MSVRRRSIVTFIAALLVVATALPGPALGAPSGGHGRYEPGAPGVGDPYFPLYGNGGYQVDHYDLSVRYDPATDELRGRAKIHAQATDDLSRFNLDLVGLTVRDVLVDGRRARWERTDHELIITPKRKLKDRRRFTVVVAYDGVPVTFEIPGFGIEAGFMHTDDGAIVAGQPEVATAWFPVNDHPIDRATYTFRITVPDGLGVIANGLPRGRSSRHGWTTHVWKARDPMVSYLATFNVGEWDIRSYRTDDGLPVIDAVDPDLGDLADASLARQGEILGFLEEQFGPYPFETIGAIVDDYEGLLFALENQTRPVYSRFFFELGLGDTVIVHELAHQWFGDLIAVQEWNDIWLNEGFATYAEWLWAEHEGTATTQEIFETVYGSHPDDDPFWDVVIGDPGVEDLFESAVYDRGAMTLQALRNEVGDDAFWEIVRTWVDQQEYGNGDTAEFIALAEEVSGQQLDELFEVWLFTGARPPASAVVPDGAARALTQEGDSGALAWLERHAAARDLRR
jgi:aminopeptidase N